jgi:hypothetical protein
VSFGKRVQTRLERDKITESVYNKHHVYHFDGSAPSQQGHTLNPSRSSNKTLKTVLVFTHDR